MKRYNRYRNNFYEFRYGIFSKVIVSKTALPSIIFHKDLDCTEFKEWMIKNTENSSNS